MKNHVDIRYKQLPGFNENKNSPDENPGRFKIQYPMKNQ